VVQYKNREVSREARKYRRGGGRGRKRKKKKKKEKKRGSDPMATTQRSHTNDTNC
jgi:hypothetical protein